MDGQGLGGGVIVLVAVALWMVYLLPSWHSRRQYDAAERNAVRLSQALRVLAETSETPEEVRLELTTRTAAAQQRLAKRALAEREQAALEEAKVQLERARAERIAAEAAARVDLERARAERAAAEAAARAEVEAAQAAARAEIEAARSTPAARRARARRRFRLVATMIGLAGLALAGWGTFDLVTVGAPLLLSVGAPLLVSSALVLHRMSRVQARAVERTADAVPRPVAVLQDVALEREQREWKPRELPRPLTASAGSRAAAVLDAQAAREALRQAALEESLRARAEAERPPSIDAARAARTASPAGPAAAGADFSRMGYVDDAEIEAHLRQLLERRASGQ
jgi:hypothetical protein